MSALMSQALRRVILVEPGRGRLNSRAAKPVLDVVQVLSDAALDDDPHAPLWLHVQEVARRAARCVRSTQLALARASKLGLIWRLEVPPARWRGGKQAPWGALIHPALIAAAREKNPGRRTATPLVFPRPWTADLDPPNMTEVHQMEYDRGAFNAGKKGSKNTAPAPKKVEPGLARKSGQGVEKVTPAPWRGAGAVEQARDSNGRPSGQGAPAASQNGRLAGNRDVPDGVSAAGGIARAVSPFARLVQPRSSDASYSSGPSQELGAARYWAWLADCASAAGWHGGQVQLVGQRRRRRDGQRGGQVPLQTTTLAGATASAQRALQLARDRGDLEVTFQLADGEHPLLLIDDLDSASLRGLPATGCAVVETSPGCYQASLMAHRPLTRAERLTAQRALACRLGGDASATSSTQLRRPPGSRNGKPSLDQPFFARLTSEPQPGTLDAGLLAQLLAEGKAAPAASAGACNKVAARNGDESRAEFGWCMAQLRAAGGLRGDALAQKLAERAAARGKHGGDLAAVADYAVRTVRACEARLAAGRP